MRLSLQSSKEKEEEFSGLIAMKLLWATEENIRIPMRVNFSLFLQTEPLFYRLLSCLYCILLFVLFPIVPLRSFICYAGLLHGLIGTFSLAQSGPKYAAAAKLGHMLNCLLSSSHCSLICLLHTACFAHALCYYYLLARWLTHWLPRFDVAINASVLCDFNPQCAAAIAHV